jgi:hypothetical protein
VSQCLNGEWTYDPGTKNPTGNSSLGEDSGKKHRVAEVDQAKLCSGVMIIILYVENGGTIYVATSCAFLNTEK